MNIWFNVTGTVSVARSVQDKLRNMAVTPQDFLAAGESISVDAGPAIRRALAVGAPVRFPRAEYILGPDPASENEGGIGAGRYGWCLKIPSNSKIIFDPGAVLKGKDGLGSWTRVISIGGNISASNVEILGELRVDSNLANAAGVGGRPGVNNEHQHGVFLYDATNVYIERIHSTNTRGDNLFIGGTNNTAGSNNVVIGSVYAAKAGRKNLVLHSCSDVFIGDALLDNRAGGAQVYGGTPDSTDGNSLDLEPDSFTGVVRNGAQIESLTTYGAGNDLLSGITGASSDAWILTVGEFISNITPRTGVNPFNMPGGTLRGRLLHVRGMTNTAPQCLIEHAARVDMDEIIFEGATTDYLLLVQAVSTNRPKLHARKATVVNTAGPAMENRNGEVHFETITHQALGLLSGTGALARRQASTLT